MVFTYMVTPEWEPNDLCRVIRSGGKAILGRWPQPRWSKKSILYQWIGMKMAPHLGHSMVIDGHSELGRPESVADREPAQTRVRATLGCPAPSDPEWRKGDPGTVVAISADQVMVLESMDWVENGGSSQALDGD
jgi:hypothetical protein